MGKRRIILLPFFILQLGFMQVNGQSNASKPADQDSDSSYLSLSLSAPRILTGSLVTISGMSIKFGAMKDVQLTIKGNAGTETKTLPLQDSGHFKTTWGTGMAGEYQVTVQSSNRKSTKTVTLKVFRLMSMDSIVQKNIDETKTAYDQLKGWIGQVKSKLGPTDAGELQKKFDDLTQKEELALQVFDDLSNLGKSLDKLQQAEGGLGGVATGGGGGTGGGGTGGGGGSSTGGGGGVSPNLSADFSKLTDNLSTQSTQMETLTKAAAHQPSDNTICEYLEMLNEACAAFSTFTTFFSPAGILKSSIVEIGRGIALDKGTSVATGAAMDAAKQNSTVADLAKESVKFSTTAVAHCADLTDKMGAVGFTGDIVTMCSSYIMSKYCGMMSGNMSEDYKCTFTNANHATWWEYTYHNEATVKLRYLKSAATSSMIKMKGNIEGNATKFTIYQKVSLMDDFRKAMKDRAQVFSICLYVPPAAPFGTSQADKKTNFGAVARAVVTPAYFNIPIDADYNPETGQMKIYCNDAIMDYDPTTVQYIYGYICIAAMIPLTARVNFPINKAKLTIAKVIEKNNNFQVQVGADHKLSFTKTAHWTNGSDGTIEHNIDVTMSAKSD